MDRSLDIKKMLAPMRSLIRALEDEHAGLAVVRADGTWQLEQNGSVRLQTTALPRESAASLVQTVHRTGPACCLTNWWVRPLDGGTDLAILFERRPDIEHTGLSGHTLELLRTRLVRDANGVIFGDHSPARSGLLLSLTRFLPQELIVYIGPRPPISPPNVTLLHIAPPRDDRDRRQLSGLLHSASAILFDGPLHRSDFRMLFPSSGVSNRWISHDATSPQQWISDLHLSPSDQTPITTNIGVRGSSVLPIRLTYLATREHTSWNVLLDHDGLHKKSAPRNPPPARVQPAPNKNRISAQITSPVIFGDREISSPELTESSEAYPIAPREETIADPLPNEESDFDVTSLLNDEDVEDIALLMESGEINVPGFVSRRQEAIQEQNDAATVKSEIADAPTSMLRGDRLDTHLPNMIAADNIDDVEIPEVDPDQLRRTMEGSLDTMQMEQNRTLREESMAQEIEPPENTRTSIEVGPETKDGLRETSQPNTKRYLSNPAHSDSEAFSEDEDQLEELQIEELEIELEPISSADLDDADTLEPARRPRHILEKKPSSGSSPRLVDRSSRSRDLPSEPAPDKSGQWRRVAQSKQRVLPIPSSSSDSIPISDLDRTLTAGPEDLDNTMSSVPEDLDNTMTSMPEDLHDDILENLKKPSEPTEELDLGGILDDLKQRRKKTED